METKHKTSLNKKLFSTHWSKWNDAYQNGIISLEKFSLPKLISLSVIADVILSLLFSSFFPWGDDNGPNFRSTELAFISGVIAAPLLETILFQYLIINFLSAKTNSLLFACLCSALIFGLSHYYSIPYIIKTFLSGILLGTLYIVAKKKEKNAYLTVVIAHTSYNLLVLISDILEK